MPSLIKFDSYNYNYKIYDIDFNFYLSEEKLNENNKIDLSDLLNFYIQEEVRDYSEYINLIKNFYLNLFKYIDEDSDYLGMKLDVINLEEIINKERKKKVVQVQTKSTEEFIPSLEKIRPIPVSNAVKINGGKLSYNPSNLLEENRADCATIHLRNPSPELFETGAEDPPFITNEMTSSQRLLLAWQPAIEIDCISIIRDLLSIPGKTADQINIETDIIQMYDADLHDDIRSMFYYNNDLSIPCLTNGMWRFNSVYNHLMERGPAHNGLQFSIHDDDVFILLKILEPRYECAELYNNIKNNNTPEENKALVRRIDDIRYNDAAMYRLFFWLSILHTLLHILDNLKLQNPNYIERSAAGAPDPNYTNQFTEGYNKLTQIFSNRGIFNRETEDRDKITSCLLYNFYKNMII